MELISIKIQCTGTVLFFPWPDSTNWQRIGLQEHLRRASMTLKRALDESHRLSICSGDKSFQRMQRKGLWNPVWTWKMQEPGKNGHSAQQGWFWKIINSDKHWRQEQRSSPWFPWKDFVFSNLWRLQPKTQSCFKSYPLNYSVSPSSYSVSGDKPVTRLTPRGKRNSSKSWMLK